MKPELLKLSAILLLASPTAVIASEYDMTFVNAKVIPLAAKLSSIPKHLRMADDTIDLLATPEYQSLRAKCTTDWAQIAANIDKVQGGNEARRLVISAFENLTPQNYMTALEAIATKVEAGVIPPGISGDGVVYDMCCPEGRMNAFVNDNFDHPRVISLLNRFKAKLKDERLKATIDRILSGDSKQMTDNMRADYEGMPEGDIPKIILPP